LATHPSDEESTVVPLINDHLNPREWRRFLGRGRRFLFKHPKLALVLAGFVLDSVSEQDKQRFLANVPPPQRIVFRLFGRGVPEVWTRAIRLAVNPTAVPHPDAEPL